MNKVLNIKEYFDFENWRMCTDLPWPPKMPATPTLKHRDVAYAVSQYARDMSRCPEAMKSAGYTPTDAQPDPRGNLLEIGYRLGKLALDIRLRVEGANKENIPPPGAAATAPLPFERSASREY
jgi:hypothetical protein